MADIVLRLYVTGRTPSAERAMAAVQAVKAAVGAERMAVEIIDVLDEPEAALNDQIFATPTLIRIKPSPTHRIFGDLSCKDRLLAKLELVAGNGSCGTSS